ncbi:MAG: cell division protein SepF [Eubacteriales bacterium]|nr:cell division protein SepF [Eubacteriales bacterium]
MGIKNFMNNVLGIDDDFDEEITEQEIEEEKAKISASKTPKSSNRTESIKVDKVEPAPTGKSYKMDNSYESIAPALSRGQLNKNYSMNGSAPFKMLVIEPKSFEECTKLVDNLKSRKPVIINLERVETEVAKKIFDFMSGATYALSGNVQRVTANIFIFAPANVDIAAKMSNREAEPTPASGNYANKETKSPWGY